MGIIYFSSSSNKHFIKDQKENPHDYKYKIIYVFDTRFEAVNMEIKLHKKFNVKMNEAFYNMSNQSHSGFDGINNVGRKASEETKSKLSNLTKGEDNPRFGIVMTQSLKDKISKSMKNSTYKDNEETRKLKHKSALNRPPVSEDTRVKIGNIHRGKNS